MSKTYFAADLHLVSGVSNINILKRFFEKIAAGETLYLLGDVFDYWIGSYQLNHPDFTEFIKLFSDKVKEGIIIRFIVGNRDFLIDKSFEHKTGVKVIGHKDLFVLNDLNAFLSHGDLIFNKDRLYYPYNRIVNLILFKRLFQSFPAAVTYGSARLFRKYSLGNKFSYIWKKEELIKCSKNIFRGQINLLICGHLHQPQIINFYIKDKKCSIIILGYLEKSLTYAVVDENRLYLERVE